MSSTHSYFRSRILSSGLHEVHSNNLEHFIESQPQEEKAIAASIDELSESTYRSPSQESAIETLRDFDDSKVLELLSVIRLPGHVHYPSHPGLSSEQFGALSELRTCPNSLVLLWLRSSRVARSQFQNPHTSGLTTTQRPATNGSTSALRRPLKTSLRPSSTLPIELPAYSGQITRDTMKSFLDRHHFLHNSPQRFSTQEACSSRNSDVQPYWCINMFCDRHHHQYVYTTCDGWKRHMKEHETVWPCMPYGPYEIAGTGVVCALCGSTNPNKSHMAGHSIGDCGDRSVKLRGVSRRANLEKHLLQSHAVSDDFARSLANKWKTTLRKKHFACGFCVSIFPTIHEQLNHIDTDHFRKGQHITEWSATKVVQGLLLSPRVSSWFQWILLSDPYAKDRSLHWEWHTVEDLQRRLEIAEDPAEILAFDAYAMLTFNLSRQNVDGQELPRSLSGLNFLGQSEVKAAFFATSAGFLEKCSENLVEVQPQDSKNPLFPDGYNVATPGAGCSISSYGSPISQSDTSEAQNSMDYQRIHSVTPSAFPTVCPSNALLSQPIHSPDQTAPVSSISEFGSISTYDSSGTNTRCQSTPSITTTGTLHSTGAADMLAGLPEIHHGHVQKEDTAAMLTHKLVDFARPTGLRGDLLLLGTCDPKDLIKKSR